MIMGVARLLSSPEYGAGHLKSTENQHKNNSRNFSTTTTTFLGRYGFIEALGRYLSLILCYLILIRAILVEIIKFRMMVRAVQNVH